MKEGVAKSSISEQSHKSKQLSLTKQIDLLLAKDRAAVYKEIEVGELVYLMSQKWLIRLRQSLKGDASLSEYQDLLINAELVEELQNSSYTYQDRHLKGHIRQQNEDSDARIRLLRQQMFERIARTFPNKPIIKLERKMITVKNQKQLQLNPLRIQIDIVSMKAIREAQKISNASQCEFVNALRFKRIKVNLYSNQTLSQLLIRVRKILKYQVEQLRLYAFQANLFKHASFERTIEYFYKRQNTQFIANQHQQIFQTLQQSQEKLQTSQVLEFFPGKMLRNESVYELKQNDVQRLVLQVKDDDWAFPHQPEFSLFKNCKYCMMKSQLYIDYHCKKQGQTFLFCSKVCHFLFLANHPYEGSKDQIVQKYGQEYLTALQAKTPQKTDFTNKSLQSQIQLDKKSVIEYIRSDGNSLAILKNNRMPLVHVNPGNFLAGGMSNLGNTCYLNASIQILIRTKLTDDLLKIEKSIDPKKSCHLATAYFNLIRKMRKLTHNQYLNNSTMKQFKSAVELSMEQFKGSQQHDVHEFILFFLNRLSQELNLNENKPPFQLQKSREKQEDEVLGRKQWLRIIQKNNSPIINLFYGQVKSQIDCPHCHQTYKKLDTFSILSISIPEKIQTTIEVYYESYLFKEKIKYLKVESSTSSIVQDVIKTAMSRLGYAEEKSELMSAFLLGYQGQCNEINKNKKVADLIPQIGKFGEKENQLFIIQKPSKQAYFILFKFLYQETPFTLKKPLSFQVDRSTLKNYKIYNAVTQYLVSIAALYLPAKIKAEDIKKNLEIQALKYFKLRLVYTKKGSLRNQKVKIWIQPDTQIQKQLLQQKVEIQVSIQKFDNPQQKNDQDSILFDIVLKKLNKFVKTDMKNLPDLKQAPQILQDCLKQEFNKKELLANGNEWFCATCNQKRRVHQTTHFYKANRYLLIQMKRFKKGTDGRFYKNYSKVKPPLELDLSQILVSPTLPSSYYNTLTDKQLETYHLTKEINLNRSTKYNLMGMILHEGILGSGHYTAIFRGQEWIQCDDHKILNTNIEKTLKQAKTMQKVYILLYERAM